MRARSGRSASGAAGPEAGTGTGTRHRRRHRRRRWQRWERQTGSIDGRCGGCHRGDYSRRTGDEQSTHTETTLQAPDGLRGGANGYTAPMAGPDEQVPPDGPDEPPQGWALRIETCRVELWRGYLTASFYARSVDRAPGLAVAEPSTAFRWRKGSGIETEEARLAHYELLARLKSEGWTLTGEGDTWYATELALPVLVPADEPDADELDDVPKPSRVAPGSRDAARARAEPEPAAPETRPPPHLVVAAAAPRPRNRLDRWRLASATGLVAALVLLGWVATHASVVGALRLPPS